MKDLLVRRAPPAIHGEPCRHRRHWHRGLPSARPGPGPLTRTPVSITNPAFRSPRCGTPTAAGDSDLLPAVIAADSELLGEVSGHLSLRDFELLVENGERISQSDSCRSPLYRLDTFCGEPGVVASASPLDSAED